MINLAIINAVPINSSFSTENIVDGATVHLLFVSEGEAESWPFSNDGNCFHPAFSFDGEAVTPSIFAGDTSHYLQACAGDASTCKYGAGDTVHQLQQCSGFAYGPIVAQGECSHRPQSSTGLASTSSFCYGEASHQLAVSSGVAHTANVDSTGFSTHQAQRCSGSASTATDRDDYLDFERDAIVTPTMDAPAFTILQFERS